MFLFPNLGKSLLELLDVRKGNSDFFFKIVWFTVHILKRFHHVLVVVFRLRVFLLQGFHPFRQVQHYLAKRLLFLRPVLFFMVAFYFHQFEHVVHSFIFVLSFCIVIGHFRTTTIVWTHKGMMNVVNGCQSTSRIRQLTFVKVVFARMDFEKLFCLFHQFIFTIKSYSN